jgi:hypothetical protein
MRYNQCLSCTVGSNISYKVYVQNSLKPQEIKYILKVVVYICMYITTRYYYARCVTNWSTMIIQYISMSVCIYKREYLNLNYVHDILQPWTWVLMWPWDLTTFECDSQYLPSWFQLLRYLYTNNLYTVYCHPVQYKFNTITYFLATFSIYNFLWF